MIHSSQNTAPLLLALLFCLAASPLQAQDAQLSQFYSNPLYINPAFAGSVKEVCDDPLQSSRANFTTRVQWKEYYTMVASYDILSDNERWGFGGTIMHDVAPDWNDNSINQAGIRRTSFLLSAAYRMKISDKWSGLFGLNGGYGIRSLSTNDLMFPGNFDQFGPNGQITADNRNLQKSKGYFDVGSGFLVYSDWLWAGASGFHLNTPNQSMIEGSSSALPIRFSAHAGMNIDLDKRNIWIAKKKDVEHHLTPVVQYKAQGKFDQVDAGLYLNYFHNYWHFLSNQRGVGLIFGVWYRGIPILKSNPANTLNHDAVVTMLGLETGPFRFGYSTDWTISQLGYDRGGAHEISLSMQFSTDRCRREPKFRSVPNPSF